MVKSLYVISDTHDDLEAVNVAIDYSKAEGREHSRIVHVGDLSLRPYTLESLDKLKRTRDVRTFITEKRSHNIGILQGYKELFDASGMPYTVIPGNYDSDLGGVFGQADIHNKLTTFGDIKVIGYGAGGSGNDAWIGPGHMALLNQMGEIVPFKPSELEKLLVEGNPDIAVIHNPPQGLCDDMFNGAHVGTPTTTQYISQSGTNLKLVLSGHIHEAGPNGNNPNGVRGIARIQNSDGKDIYVINPGNLGRFEILDNETLEPRMQFDYGTFVRVDIEDDGTPVKLTQYSVQEDKRTIGQVRIIGQLDLK